MAAYYNEIDPYAVQWLKNLIAAGHIASGEVDERSIVDVRADDLKGFTQLHFFAGIAGWSHALRLAGWDDDKPVWTGSCPCQPISVAGKRKGKEDERHLWPEFYRLIAERVPTAVIGEQVGPKDGRLWLAGIRADLEALGYAVGAADISAAGIGAPHIRQRLYWVGVADGAGWFARQSSAAPLGQGDSAIAAGELCGLADTDIFTGAQGRPVGNGRNHRSHAVEGAGSGSGCIISGLGDTGISRLEERSGERCNHEQECTPAERAGCHAFWSGAEWHVCLDGKARRVKHGIYPLADVVPGRVGRLRAYGNAIVPALAAEFVAAFMECAP